MRTVVTGGAGFVGSHLVEALLARGDEVVCVERPGARRAWIEGLPVTFADVGLEDPEALDRLLAGAGVVYHLAALTTAARPADYYAVNAEGTASIMAAASRAARPPRVVLMSSLAAAGPCRNGDLLSDRTVPYPLSHYGQSKLIAEAVVRAYGERVPHTILRFPPVYGPRDRAVLIMFRLVRRGVALTVGGWDREVSLVYVADAVRALIAAGGGAGEGGLYTVAHPRPITWRQFAIRVGDTLHRSPSLVAVPRRVAVAVAVAAEAAAAASGRAAILNRQKVRELTQKRWVCDGRRAARELGVEPAFPIERGVPATARWYEEAGWI